MTKRPSILRLATLGLLAAAFVFPGGCGDGSDALESGMTLLRDGNSATAIPLLEKAARRDPENATAHCNLGIALAAQGQSPRATASFRRAAELAPEDPRPLELLGEMFLDLERWDEARNVLAEAQDRARSSARILAARGAAEFGAGRIAAAQDLFQRALRLEPGYPPALYNMARVFQQYPDGDTTAIDYLEQYLGSGPVDSRYSALARQQMLALRKKLAGPVSPGPSPAEPLVAAAQEAIANQDFTRALIRLKDAVRSDPAFADAQWELAKLYDEYLEDPETAIELYGRFIARFPGDARVAAARERQEALTPPDRPALADIVGRSGPDPERGARAFDAAVEAHRTGDWQAAADEYRKALSYDAEHSLAALNLGQVLKAAGDLEGACEALQYALKVKPDRPETGYRLAEVYRALGQRPEAELLARNVASEHPGYTRIYYLLGLLSRDAQDLEKAREHFRKYVELSPADDPQAVRVKQWLDAR